MFGKRKQQETPELVLPERGENVLLSLPRDGNIPARVVEVREEEILVAITVPTRPLDAATLAKLELDFASSRGRVRLHGSFSYPDPSDPELLCMHEARSVEVMQEREHVRVRTARPVYVSYGEELGQVETYTVDVSGGGLLLAGPDTLRPGDIFSFRLVLQAKDTAVTGKGRVVRVDGMGRRAVCFEEMSEGDRRRLVHFIFDCQRGERKRGLEGAGDGGR